jgi:crotonobetainyl-CoA:carnitine CoA-transferase CaiB-like acyl-CoA transferase
LYAQLERTDAMAHPDTPATSATAGPLSGLRVLELGQLLAGPFASVLLAWFGADVIKVEPPDGGDPIRSWRAMYKGTALWWLTLGRNKRCVTADLRKPEGRAIVKRLVTKCDVLLENFRPGRLEEWGLGYDALEAIRPGLIMCRVSGYGQTGPYSAKPGYASVAEGIGGFRYVNGYPDLPPARPNLSIGDTVAGLHAALGILTAVYHRDVKRTGEGQVVDVALYEGIFNLMESVVPEFDKLGLVRERQGASISGIVPTNTYRCGDGKYIIIGGNGDSIFRRLMQAAGRPDLADDPRLARNDGRVLHQAEIDAAIGEWTGRRPFDEVLTAMEEAQVPAGPILNIADQVGHPQFLARGMFERVAMPDDPGDTVLLPRFAPLLTHTPGATQWAGPPLGAHNREVYGGLLGMSDQEIEDLRAKAII